MNAVKAAIIAGTKDLAAREALRCFPGCYFQVAAETCDDAEDRHSIMWRLVELYGEYVAQLERQNDVAAARLAEQRRGHLRVVTTDDPCHPGSGVQELSPDHSTEGAAP